MRNLPALETDDKKTTPYVFLFPATSLRTILENYRLISDPSIRASACQVIREVLRSQYNYRVSPAEKVWGLQEIALLRRTIIELRNADKDDQSLALLYAYGNGMLSNVARDEKSQQTADEARKLIKAAHLSANLGVQYSMGSGYFRDLQKFTFFLMGEVSAFRHMKWCPWLRNYLSFPLRRMILDAQYCCRFNQSRWADVDRVLRYALQHNMMSEQLVELAGLLEEKIAETHQMFVWDEDIPYYSSLENQATGILRFFLEKAKS